VINRNGYVGYETRQKVERAIRKLKYRPNVLAQSLISKQTKAIGVVITDITNPFFTTLVRGVEDSANKRGFNTILCNSDEDCEKQRSYIEVLLQKRIDGILIAPSDRSERQIQDLQREKTPFVLIDRRIDGIKADTVMGDSLGGAEKVVEHLIKLGHRRIALINGPLGVSTAKDRLEGYKNCLRKHGIAVEEALIKVGQFERGSGYEKTLELMCMNPPPTAIFACNNFLALGAIRALREKGVRIPEDVALVSFDDIEIASVIHPFLTAVTQPAYTIGTIATEILIDRIEGRIGKDSDSGKTVVLQTELIVRESCGYRRVQQLCV
jgi:LacI family transcriptional regulator